MLDQIEYMNRIKWFKGIEINSDPTESFLIDWVKKGGAEEFRKKWEKENGSLNDI
jgi:hypothetical protein